MSEIWVNDVDLGLYGFACSADPRHLDAPELKDGSIVLAGRLGPVWSGEVVQGSPRRLVVAGSVVGTTAADYAQKVDSLKGLFGRAPVRIRTSDRATQEYRDGRLVSCSVSTRPPTLASSGGEIAAAFEVNDPVRYDIDPQGIALSTSRADLPIGTAPSEFPTYVVHGGGAALTNPVFTIRNAAGDVVATHGLTGALGANDYLRIDGDRTQITLYTAGVASDALSWWASGDFLAVRSIDGDYEAGAYPTIEVSSATGTPAGLITYARGWL